MDFRCEGDSIPQAGPQALASAQGRMSSAAHSTALPARKPPTSERRRTPRTPKTVAELYALHEDLAARAKALYDQKDATLKKLVRVWKKDRSAKVDEKHYLEIEDKFRGQTKAFAPGFAHRYNLKLRTIEDAS
jgi:hypothetical protein